MISKEQAESLSHGQYVYFLDKSGNRALYCRVSGKLKTWKTRPSEWKLPVKYGLYENAYIGSAAGCEDPERFFLTLEELDVFLPIKVKGRIGTKIQRKALDKLYASV